MLDEVVSVSCCEDVIMVAVVEVGAALDDAGAVLVACDVPEVCCIVEDGAVDIATDGHNA